MNPIKPFVYYAVGFAFVALLAFAGVKQVQVWKLKADNATQAQKITRLETDNSALTSANAACATSVEKQNEKIDAMKRQAETRAEAARLAVAAAEQDAAKHIADAEAILARKMAKPGDECGSLEVLIDEAIKGRAK